jgi:mannosyltransferase
MHSQEQQDGDHALEDRPFSLGVSPHAPGVQHGVSAGFLVAALTVLAFILRFWRLGKWSLDSDEVFMLRDSLEPSLSNPRPLLYYLNHFLVAPFLPLDELGLRLLPAIFGVLAIPVFYLIARRLVGSRAAVFGALLLTVNPLHVYYSQFARYWSLVFLLSSVYPYAIYIGLRERNRNALVLGIVTGVLASLAHPSAVILTGGLGLWILITYVTRAQLAQLWHQRGVRWGLLVAGILLLAIAIRFVPILNGWLYYRTRDTTFLFHMPSGRGMREISYLLSFIESTTVPLFLTATAGVYLLWQLRDRSLALFLLCLFLFQLVFLSLVRLLAPASTFYLVPALPVLFIGAGVFLDRLAGLEWKLRPRWLFSATAIAMIIAAGAPTLISQYLDGRRWDFRSVAHWLDGPLLPDDIVFSDQYRVMAHYLPESEIHPLIANPVRLEEALRTLHATRPNGAIWVVAPAPSHAFRTNPNLNKLSRWMYDRCQLRNSVGVGRVDFRQQYLEIFRCPRD